MGTTRRTYGGFGMAAALVAMAVSGTASAAEPREEYVETIEQTFRLNAGGSFSLRNTNGSVDVATWDKDEVHIVAEKRMRLDDGPVSWLWRLLGLRSEKIESEEDAKQLFETLAVEFAGDDTRREVTTRYPESTQGVSYSVAFRVTLPRRVNASIDVTNGSVDVEGIDGGVDLESTSGSITAHKITGHTSVQSTNGRIRVEDISGDLEARTTNGSVEARFLPEASNLGSVAMRSTNGSVKLYLPEGAAFDLKMRTTNGGLTCDFPLASTTLETRRRLEGRVGEGGAEVELQTTNGSVRVLPLS